ncbi:MAG: GAF domain-containing protein, partial [Acidimicrobiales bacterium]
LGQLVGVLTVEAVPAASYGEADEASLTVVASLVANAIETIRAEERAAIASSSASSPTSPSAVSAGTTGPATHVRFFAVDGSTFLEGDYVIKGVAGRLLWSLLRQYDAEGRTDFTNREVRLDPTLDLPDFRDNFESRLILLKRRLDERAAPIRIEKTGRGRFRLVVDTALRLEQAGG